MPNLGAVLTAMVTPFDQGGSVDFDAATKLINFLIDNGSDGLVVCGTTGEVSTLTDDEHIALIELAVDVADGRATIIAGTGSNDTRHAVELTERASAFKIDGILSVTPYYNRPNRRGILAHFGAVAGATDQPVVLYNIPARTGTDMPNGLLAELAQIKNIQGLKQSRATDVEIIPGLDLYAGNDEMFLEVLELGGAGVISVASHIVGPEMQRMVTDPQSRVDIDASLADIYEVMGVTTNPIPIKAALKLLGHQVGGLRLPLVEADQNELEAVRNVLQRHKLLERTIA